LQNPQGKFEIGLAEVEQSTMIPSLWVRIQPSLVLG
jgi:hypothetical protein